MKLGRSGARLRRMNSKQLMMGLAIALSVVACKKKETENAKPADKDTKK